MLKPKSPCYKCTNPNKTALFEKYSTCHVKECAAWAEFKQANREYNDLVHANQDKDRVFTRYRIKRIEKRELAVKNGLKK